MSCPTCDHTVECFGIVQETQLFHCPRCGTVLEVESDGARHVHMPKLVERCREYEKQLADALILQDSSLWLRLGIAESINLPGDRPT